MTNEVVQALVCDTRAMTAAHVSGLLCLLSREEQDRQERFAFAQDRRDYVAAHVLLRIALAGSTGTAPDLVHFGATGRGKPFLVPAQHGAPTPSFSLTHSRGLVACVIGGHDPVGIDVEPVDRSIRTLEIARRFFSVEETKALLQCAEDERPGRFCELWTLKESLAKASGAGLGQSLRYPSFRMSPGGLRVSGAPGWSFLLADIGGTHKLAVARSQRSVVRLSAADPFHFTQGVLMTPVSDAT